MNRYPRLLSLLASEKVQIGTAALLLWWLHAGLDFDHERLRRLPIETFQPAAAPPATSIAPTDLPLLRLVSAGPSTSTPAAAAIDLDRLFHAPPSDAPPRAPMPPPTPPPSAPPPTDYAALLSSQLRVQAASQSGLVVDGVFVAWGEPLPFSVPSPDHSSQLTPRLLRAHLSRRTATVRVSVADQTVPITVPLSPNDY